MRQPKGGAPGPRRPDGSGRGAPRVARRHPIADQGSAWSPPPYQGGLQSAGRGSPTAKMSGRLKPALRPFHPLRVPQRGKRTGEKCRLDEAQAAVRALLRAASEGGPAGRAGDLGGVVVDDGLRRLTLRVARPLIPGIVQDVYGVLSVETCDRKPERDASALARAGRRDDARRDSQAGE